MSVSWPPSLEYRCGTCSGDLTIRDGKPPIRLLYCETCNAAVGVIYPVGSNEDLEGEFERAALHEQSFGVVPIDLSASKKLGLQLGEAEPEEPI